MIRPSKPGEEPLILSVISDGAAAYRGKIPAECWKEPYMDAAELRVETGSGVDFWCAEESGRLVGVMGLQDVEDVTLIRHSYVRTDRQGQGIGKSLLTRLMSETDRPVLAGTWAAADWALRFYIKNGFSLLSRRDGEMLLRRYWKIPALQSASSVVLGDGKWCTERGSERLKRRIRGGGRAGT